jgi:8-oxo-dGTP pyrophosphatase MutT (NUDIX family)
LATFSWQLFAAVWRSFCFDQAVFWRKSMNRIISRILVKDSEDKFLVFWHKKLDGSLEPDLPGGGREPEEDLRSCAVRELTEETGLQRHFDYHPSQVQEIATIQYTFTNYLGHEIEASGSLFLVPLWRSQPPLKINEPSLDRYEWLTREELQVLNIPYLREVDWS